MESGCSASMARAPISSSSVNCSLEGRSAMLDSEATLSYQQAMSSFESKAALTSKRSPTDSELELELMKENLAASLSINEMTRLPNQASP